jgi:hypothetical protein
MSQQLSKDEIQILIQIVESMNFPVKQTEEIILPLLQKLRAMLEENNEEE